MLGTVNGLVQESLMSLLSLRGSRGSHQAAPKLARHFAKSAIFACLSHQKVGFNSSECISELGFSELGPLGRVPKKKINFRGGPGRPERDTSANAVLGLMKLPLAHAFSS